MEASAGNNKLNQLAKTIAKSIGITKRLDNSPTHVPDPKKEILACSKLLKPSGKMICSTINRNLKSFVFAIIGAEYILKLLPKGTHEYKKFIKPSELIQVAREENLELIEIIGMTYNPFTKIYRLSNDADVNYIVALTK